MIDVGMGLSIRSCLGGPSTFSRVSLVVPDARPPISSRITPIVLYPCEYSHSGREHRSSYRHNKKYQPIILRHLNFSIWIAHIHYVGGPFAIFEVCFYRNITAASEGTLIFISLDQQSDPCQTHSHIPFIFCTPPPK